MHRFALAVIVVLSVVSNTFAQQGIPIRVTFDQKAANTINSAVGFAVVSAGASYSASYVMSDAQHNKVDVWVSVYFGTISGSGSLQQTTSESGKISIQRPAYFMGDAGVLIRTRISMTFTYGLPYVPTFPWWPRGA